MAYGLKYTASAYGLSSVEWKVELLENGYSGTSSNIQLIGNGIKIGYDKEDDRFNLIYSRYAIIDLKVTSTFNLDSLQFDDERKFQVKIYKNDVLEFIGWLIPFYSSQEFEDTSLATISIQAKDGINQLKNIAFYNSNPTAISFKQSFKDIISQSLLQTGYELDLEIFYNKYDASMAKSTSDCPLAQLYFNINTLSKNENEWHDFYEVLNRLLSIHNLRLFQTNGKWTIIDQMDLIEGVIYGRKYNSAGVYQSNVTLNSDTLIHTGGLKVKSNSIIRKDVPFKQYSAFFNAGALSNLLKNGELTSFNGSMPNGWTKVGTWAYGSYGANVIDGVTNGIKFQNKYTQSLNYDDSAYFESEEIDISSYNAFTLDFEAYADATIDAIKIGIKLYSDNPTQFPTEYFVDKNGIARIDGRSAIIEKGFLDTFFKFQIECNISASSLYYGEITRMKVRIYPGFTYNTVPTNTIVKYRNIQLKAKDEEVSNFKGRYFQVTNVDLPKTSKNAETYDIYFQDNIDYIKANYNNFLYVGDSDIETQSWKRNTDTESNTLVVSVLKDKLAVTASYNDIFEGSVFGYIDFTKTPKLSVDNKRFLILSSEYNLQDNTSELTLVELKTNEISYNTNTTDDYGGNNTVNSTSSHGSFNLDANQVRKYVPEAGGNMYGDLLVTGTIDAVPTTSTDTLATNKGILDIGINFADIINIGSDTSVLNLFGDILVDKGLIQLNADGNTDIGFSVLTSDIESNYFKLISDKWVTDTGFKANYYDFNITNTDVNAVGRLRWNDVDGTLDLGLKGGNVTLQLGQEEVLRVVNKTGATLNEADFRVVRIRDISEGGSQGQRLAVVLAQGNSDANSATTIGIVTETIAGNQEGFITISGNVSEINTTGAKSYGGAETWLDGDILYLDPINQGYLTKVKPQAPNHTIIVGWVVYAHANHGKIFVKVDNGYELEELHNVKITSVADKDILTWNSTTNVWENLSLTELSGVNGSGTTNYIAKWTDADTITDSIIFDNGTNVGIGTNTPFSKLILSGASGASIFGIESNNATANANLGAIGFKNTNATSPYLSAITSTFGANTTSSYLSFRLGTASASPFSLTEIARISSNGNFILGGTFTDLGTKLQVIGDSYFSGRIGIGVVTLTGYNLRMLQPITGATTTYAISQAGTIQSDVTSQSTGFFNQLLTQATSFTLSQYFHISLNQSTLGAGSSVTSQYGLYVSPSLVGATNNYAIFSSIPSGSNNNWNLYISGTAPNYMAGSLGIGTTSLTGYNLRLSKTITGATTSYGISQNGAVQSDVTSQAIGIGNTLSTQATSFTLTTYFHFFTLQSTLGAGSSITNQYGYYAGASMTGASNNYAFWGGITSGTNNWNLYMSGNAKNYLNGSLLVKTTTDAGYILDVNGTARFTGIVQFDSIPTTSVVPSSANHIVNKAYVDSLALVKRGDNVKTISLSNITLSGTQTVSGVALSVGDYVLVAGQTTNQTQNGVYVVASGAWTRSTTNDSDAEIRGAYHYITAGTYANQRYINTNTSAITVGTTNITYGIDFGAETDPIWTAFKTANSITETSISNWNTAYTNTTNGTFYLATNPSNYITLSSLSAGTGLSYNAGVFSYTGTIYTDSSIRALISATSPITYNSSTGAIAINVGNTTTDGYITSTDWNTFNNKIGGSGTTNYIAKYSGTSAITNSQIFDNGTNIGIGTASPTKKLDINGSLGFLGGYFERTSSESRLFLSNSGTTSYSGSYIYLTTTDVQSGDTYNTTRISTDKSTDGTNQYQIARNFDNTYNGLIYRYNDIEGHRFYNASSRTATTTSASLSIYYNGNIGIGTTTPSYKLHVLGDININTGYVYRINGVDVSTNWTTAYNRSITAINISGTTSKTLTLTKQDGTTLTASFSDLNAITSVNGLTGTVVLTTSNIAEGTNLYFTNARVLATTLAGYSVGANSAITTTDTILGAFGKIQGQINSINSSSKLITLSGDVTGSGNVGSTIATTINTSYSGFTNYYTKTATDTLLSGYYNKTESDALLNAKENTITAGNTSQYWRGDKTWQLLSTDVVIQGQNNKYLTQDGVLEILLGSKYSAGSDVALTTTDTILSAFRKIQGQLNARLTQNQTITITGDASGSGNNSIALTLANSGVTAGTYRSITVDVKGRVTAGTNPTTIAGYGITDLLSQTLTNFATGTDTSITASNTILGAFQVAQGQINARLNKSSITAGTNYILKHSGNYTLSNSQLFDNGTNIGIGTTTPTSKLHIVGSVLLQSNGYIDFSINQTDSARLGLGITSATNNTFINTINNETEHISGTSKFTLLFNGIEKFRFTSDGKLGINNNNPNNALDITGDLNVSGKIKINGSNGIDHQFIKFDGTNTVWAKLNTGELEDGNDLVKYVMDNGEKGIKLYSGDSTATVKDTMGFIFTNEDTGIVGIHGYRLNGTNIEQFGLHIDQDTNLYRLKADGKRVRLLTTEDSIGSSTGGTSYTFEDPLVLSNNQLKIKKASATTNGYLSADDWVTFKNISSTGVNFSATTPLNLSNGVISIQQASENQAGYITKDDYISFRDKIGGSGGTINGGDLIIKTELKIGNLDNSNLGSLLYIGNTLSLVNTISNSNLYLQAPNVSILATKFYIGDKLIDMSNFAIGKVLKATSSTKAEWVNI